jgi:hypothetical protein
MVGKEMFKVEGVRDPNGARGARCRGKGFGFKTDQISNLFRVTVKSVGDFGYIRRQTSIFYAQQRLLVHSHKQDASVIYPLV